MNRNTFKKDDIYTTCSKEERDNIRNRCNSGGLQPTTKTGKKTNYYKKGKKHDPFMDIPTKIFTLKEGKISDLKEEYNEKYGPINAKKIQDYIREMIKQGIIIKKVQD